MKRTVRRWMNLFPDGSLGFLSTSTPEELFAKGRGAKAVRVTIAYADGRKAKPAKKRKAK